MVINKAILHIADSNSGLFLLSNAMLDVSDSSICKYISTHVEKIANSTDMRQGVFSAESDFKKRLLEYYDQEINFIDFSAEIASTYVDAISTSSKKEPVDILVCDYSQDNKRFFAILFLTNISGYTHHVDNTNGIMHNTIINHYSILPNFSQKINECVLINADSQSISFSDKFRFIDGNDVRVIPDVLLKCTTSPSPKEVMKAIKTVTRAVSQQNGKNPALIESKAKQYILDNIEMSEQINLAEMSQEVFNHSEDMQAQFIKGLEKTVLSQMDSVQVSASKRSLKSQKIRTDTGIEITFPVDYYNNREFIEFTNNPNGTISIQINNIGKLENR